jgi:ankyrin repeat protein
MAASVAPPPPRKIEIPTKCYQQTIADAVIEGSLSDLKNCFIPKHMIDRRLLPHSDLKYTPKYNRDERYVQLAGPTVTMLAILCEQDELLDYILMNLGPDLSVQVEGLTALHLAAIVKDPRPLQLLLRNQWIQENIDLPLNLPGIQPEPGDFTTALHCAVNNRRYAQVLLLLSDFPDIPDSDRPRYRPANADQRSANGSTPIYIAVYLRDSNLVRILLAANCDATIECRSGKSAVTLAMELRAAAEEDDAKRAAAEAIEPWRKRLRRKPGDSAIRTAQLLEGDVGQTLDDLKAEFAPWLVPDAVPVLPAAELSPEEDFPEKEAAKMEIEPVRKAKHGRKKAKRRESPPAVDTLQILRLLKSLEGRIQRMESDTQRAQSQGRQAREAGQPTVGSAPVCAVCGTFPAQNCETCHRWFCGRCGLKAAVHACIE